MLDLQSLHVRARRRRASVVLERGLEEAARVAKEEGFAGEVIVLERFDALLRYAEGGADAVVLDQQGTEAGLHGVVLLAGARLVLAAPIEGLRDAARLLARLGAEARVVALLGADPAAAREAGLVVRQEKALPQDANLAYAPAGGFQDLVNHVLWSGATPLAAVRLDAPRPLVAAMGDAVEAVALAGALAG